MEDALGGPNPTHFLLSDWRASYSYKVVLVHGRVGRDMYVKELKNFPKVGGHDQRHYRHMRYHCRKLGGLHKNLTQLGTSRN